MPALRLGMDQHRVRVHHEAPRLGVPRGGCEHGVAHQEAKLLFDREGPGKRLFRDFPYTLDTVTHEAALLYSDWPQQLALC